MYELVYPETIEAYYTYTDESELMGVWGGAHRAKKSNLLPSSSVAFMSIIFVNSTSFVFRDIICMWNIQVLHSLQNIRGTDLWLLAKMKQLMISICWLCINKAVLSHCLTVNKESEVLKAQGVSDRFKLWIQIYQHSRMKLPTSALHPVGPRFLPFQSICHFDGTYTECWKNRCISNLMPSFSIIVQ